MSLSYLVEYRNSKGNTKRGRFDNVIMAIEYYEEKVDSGYIVSLYEEETTKKVILLRDNVREVI